MVGVECTHVAMGWIGGVQWRLAGKAKYEQRQQEQEREQQRWERDAFSAYA